MGGANYGGYGANSSPMAARRLRAALGSRWTQALLGLLLMTALALESAALVRQAHAATLDVCASGCAYKSINDALAAAAPGDTITVKAGTYGPNETGVTKTDAQITINKPVNLVGAGVGKAIINDAPANQGKATSGVISITTPATPGNITVSGFTIEGAIVNDQNDDGILMMTTDTRASDVVTIKNNLFYGDTTLDPTNQLDQTDSIYVYSSNATTSITNNTFKGVFRAALIEGDPGPVNFTGNDLNLHGLYDPATPSQLDYWAEGMLFLGDSGANVSSPQVVSGNTFESYAGMGVGVDAGYSGGLVGAFSNISITSNTFNVVGIAAAQSSTPDDAAISMRAFGTSNGTTTSTISGATIKYNTFRENSGDGRGYAIRLTGSFAGNNSIDHNVLIGGGSSRPLAAINLLTPASSIGLSITHNIITGFATGISSDGLPSGAQVSATQNCVAGNSSAGATVAAGTALAATNNWWGAASGSACGL